MAYVVNDSWSRVIVDINGYQWIFHSSIIHYNHTFISLQASKDGAWGDIGSMEGVDIQHKNSGGK